MSVLDKVPPNELSKTIRQHLYLFRVLSPVSFFTQKQVLTSQRNSGREREKGRERNRKVFEQLRLYIIYKGLAIGTWTKAWILYKASRLQDPDLGVTYSLFTILPSTASHTGLYPLEL